MTRWTVDYNSKGDEFEKVERLTDHMGEFPRIDDRYATQNNRYGWLLVMDASLPFNGPSARASGLPQLRLNSGYTQVLKNAPDAREGFFAVPKVVE